MDITKSGQLGKTIVFVVLAVLLSEVVYYSFCYYVLLAILLVVAVFCTYSQDYSRNNEVAALVAELEQLPMDFLPDGPTPFVILTFQRTGSNLLCGKLHNHQEIIMHNELFNNAKIWTYQNENLLADPTFHWDIISRDANPIAFLEDIFHRKSMKKDCKAVGFKLFPDHWTAGNGVVMKKLVADKRVKKIILKRDNYLDVYASKLRSDKTGAYVSKNLDNVPIWIDNSAFESFINYYDDCYAYYDSLVQHQEVLKVKYEDLIHPVKEREEVKKVLDFLQVDSSFLPATLNVTKKQTTRPLCEGIKNYEEVKAAFKLHPKNTKNDLSFIWFLFPLLLCTCCLLLLLFLFLFSI